MNIYQTIIGQIWNKKKMSPAGQDSNLALFIDSLSTDCVVFVDILPAFRPAEVARQMY